MISQKEHNGNNYVYFNLIMIYKLLSVASIIIRFLYGPNPFEYLPNGEVLNLIFGGILVPITYFMVSLIYQERSMPSLGSILFLTMYFVNGYVFKYIMFFYPNWILVTLLTIAYISFCIFIAYKINN